MPVYSAIVDVVVHRSYTVILETEDAFTEAQAEAQIRSLAQDLDQRRLEALCDAAPTKNQMDNVYTEVVAVREVEEEEPDEEEVVLDRIKAEDSEDRAWGEFAAADPEGALEEALDLADREDEQQREDEQRQREIEEGRL